MNKKTISLYQDSDYYLNNYLDDDLDNYIDEEEQTEKKNKKLKDKSYNCKHKFNKDLTFK